MTQLTVLLDANILYPAPMRDIFLQLAVDDAFRARWAADIHREWIDALLRNEPRHCLARCAPPRLRPVGLAGVDFAEHVECVHQSGATVSPV